MGYEELKIGDLTFLPPDQDNDIKIEHDGDCVSSCYINVDNLKEWIEKNVIDT